MEHILIDEEVSTRIGSLLEEFGLFVDRYEINSLFRHKTQAQISRETGLSESTLKNIRQQRKMSRRSWNAFKKVYPLLKGEELWVI